VNADGVIHRLRCRWVRRRYRATAADRPVVMSAPTNAAFIPILKKSFSDARFVHLRRDPVYVLASMRRFLRATAVATPRTRFRRYYQKEGVLSGFRAIGSQYFHRMRWLRSGRPGFIHLRPPGFFEGRHHAELEFLCWYYTLLEDWIDYMLRDVADDRKIDIFYDRLIGSDPRAEFARLIEFIGVSVDEMHMARTIGSIRPSGKLGDFSDAELEQARQHLDFYREHSPLVVTG
jgi:hypothetical protein